jgi:hypothetical protein
MDNDKKVGTIAIIGATGALGSGLAMRWARAGHDVIIGSRDGGRAVSVAEEHSAKAGAKIRGMENPEAAQAGEIIVLTVPYENHRANLETVRPHATGKIVIDVTVPLMPPKVRTVQLPEEGSAAKAAQMFLGEDVRVVSAFQNIAAAHLAELDHDIDCDVLVCGNDKNARQIVVDLADAAGMKAWHAGRVDNSAVAEAFTSALIFINGHYKVAGAGFRLTGVPGSAAAPT